MEPVCQPSFLGSARAGSLTVDSNADGATMAQQAVHSQSLCPCHPNPVTLIQGLVAGVTEWSLDGEWVLWVESCPPQIHILKS